MAVAQKTLLRKKLLGSTYAFEVVICHLFFDCINSPQSLNASQENRRKKSPLNSDKTVKWAEFVILNYS
jgi:hypothetical protein